MRPGLVFQLFWRTSRVQKKRAVLTVAAIAWGSLSLVLLLAYGEGLKRNMTLASQGMGTNLAIMWPGETTMDWQGMPAGRPIRPRIEDINLLRGRMQGMAGVSGEITSWRVAFTWGDRTVNSRLTGASLIYGQMRNQIPRMGGRFLNPLDDAQRRRSVFLGFDLAEDIFGDVDPVGEALLVDNVPYTVVGVMVEKMQNNSYGGMDKDHAIIPIRTFWAQYGRDRLSVIVIKPDNPLEMPAKLRQVREILGGKYGFSPDDERVLGTWDTVETSAIMQNMMMGIQMFLGIIGALTLTVGGIGVANIMYAVVKERTREIGVKMALGARASWVTGPIVLEGLTYTLLGGLIGLLMATLVILLLGLVPVEGNDALEMMGKPTLSVPIAMATAGILGIIGLMAGYFPARRAAGVDPAQTLRYE
jgi:putative ABC transport system permease protein